MKSKMPKILTDTNIWDKEWFRELPPHIKTFWSYLRERSNPIGVWEGDFGLASFLIGEKITEEDIEKYPKLFNGRIQKLNNGKWLLPGVVWFRYGDPNKFKGESKLHQNLIKLMEQHSVKDIIINYLSTVGTTVGTTLEQEYKETETETETNIKKETKKKIIKDEEENIQTEPFYAQSLYKKALKLNIPKEIIDRQNIAGCIEQDITEALDHFASKVGKIRDTHKFEDERLFGGYCLKAKANRQTIKKGELGYL